MRAFSGQMSDNATIRRTPQQKVLQLRQLKEQFANLKSHVAPSLRESMARRIVELEQELAGKA